MDTFFSVLKRITVCFRSVLLDSCVMAVVFVYFYFLGNILWGYKGHFLDLTAIAAALLIFQGFSVITLLFLKGRKYKASIIHKYDHEIIGENFKGIGTKDIKFEQAAGLLFLHKHRDALNLFHEIKEKHKLTEDEKGVLDFYLARCYHAMQYPANALKYYEEARQKGFDHDLLSIFEARCHGEMDNMDTAVELYSNILETENRYKALIRTDIGRLFLLQDKSEEALKWFLAAVEKNEDFANALGGCALAYTLLHDFEKGEHFFRRAILNNIPDSHGFTMYFKEVQAMAVLENRGERELV